MSETIGAAAMFDGGLSAGLAGNPLPQKFLAQSQDAAASKLPG